jgi:hypothetical protein
MRHPRLMACGGLLGLALTLSSAVPLGGADRKVYGEIGGGVFSLTYGETSQHQTGVFFNLGGMGRNLGFEVAGLTKGFEGRWYLVASLIVSTNTTAPVSVFFSIGAPLPFEALPVGVGLRVKVTPRFCLIGRAVLWMTYEGGPLYAIGGNYRF